MYIPPLIDPPTEGHYIVSLFCLLCFEKCFNVLNLGISV